MTDERHASAGGPATEAPGDVDIAGWCRDIVEGPGGMIDQETHEGVIYHVPDRVAAVMWAVRCLANPRCAGSVGVLAAIGERRAEVAAEIAGADGGPDARQAARDARGDDPGVGGG